jgi:hypothetical protein
MLTFASDRQLAVEGSLAQDFFHRIAIAWIAARKTQHVLNCVLVGLKSVVVAVIKKLHLGVNSETLSCQLLCYYSTADAAVITASGRYRSNVPTTAM